VHAIPSQEAAFINGKRVKKGLVRLSAIVDMFVTRASDTRIFIHPDLQRYFEKRGWQNRSDFVCYNGGAPEEALTLSKEQARADLGLSKVKFILVFVGSASAWHGIEFLVSLSREFRKCRDDIVIVCGGGDVSAWDPETV
jgi:hypothetical protein